MNILSSFTVYTAALHALILILFYLLTSGLGYPGLIVFQQLKHFHSQKTSSRKPYTSSKQQERHKHSVGITKNFKLCALRVAYPLMRHMHAQIYTGFPISPSIA